MRPLQSLAGPETKSFASLKSKTQKPLRQQLSLPFQEGKPEAIPIQLESPLVAQSFLAVHSKEWPWSTWSYYEKGENGLIAIEFAGAERKERADSAGNQKPNPHILRI